MLATLTFPDSKALADFLAKYQIQKAEVKSTHNEMTAEMEDDDIIDAVSEFDATVYVHKKKITFH